MAYYTIHESVTIPPSHQKGTQRGCTKWKSSIGGREGQKTRLFWVQNTFGGAEWREQGGLSGRLLLLSMGDGEGPRDGTLIEVDQKIPI